MSASPYSLRASCVSQSRKNYTTNISDTHLASIQAQRAFVLQKYTRKLLAFTEDYTSAAFALEVPNYSRKLARHISDFELLPPRTSATLRECLERLSTIHVPTMQQDSYPRAQHEMLSQKHWITLNRTSPYGIRAHHSNSGWETWTPPSPRPVSPAYTAPQARIEPPTKKDLEHLIEKIRRSCVGLCLDCVQGNFNCRERHSQRWKGSEALPQDMFWAYDTEAKAAEDDGWWPPGNSPAPSSPRGDF